VRCSSNHAASLARAALSSNADDFTQPHARTASPELEFLNPTLDVVFRMLLLRNQPLLHSMLEAVLGEPIHSFTVQDREIPGEAPPDKAIVLDLLVVLHDGRRVNVEMQVRASRETKPRLAFYAARNFVEQLSRGDEYRALGPSIVIVWLVAPLFPELERFHSVFELRERNTNLRRRTDPPPPAAFEPIENQHSAGGPLRATR
jgi:hypothetical protein